MPLETESAVSPRLEVQGKSRDCIPAVLLDDPIAAQTGRTLHAPEQRLSHSRGEQHETSGFLAPCLHGRAAGFMRPRGPLRHFASDPAAWERHQHSKSMGSPYGRSGRCVWYRRRVFGGFGADYSTRCPGDDSNCQRGCCVSWPYRMHAGRRTGSKRKGGTAARCAASPGRTPCLGIGPVHCRCSLLSRA